MTLNRNRPRSLCPGGTPPIRTDALVIGAGPVGLFQVFQLGLQDIHAQVVDARRPKQEAMAPAVAPPAPVVVVKKPLRNWSLPGTLASLAAVLFLVAE